MAHSFDDVVRSMTPEIYNNMRSAVELGRWPDGRQVTAQQRETCMQAVIAWEKIHLPEDQRSGYLPAKDCGSDTEQERPLTLRPAGDSKDA